MVPSGISAFFWLLINGRRSATYYIKRLFQILGAKFLLRQIETICDLERTLLEWQTVNQT